MTLTARAARWSAANWKKATFGWLAFAVCTIVLGQLFGAVKLTHTEQGNGESGRAETMLLHAGFSRTASEVVLVQDRHASIEDPRFRAVIAEVTRALGSLPQVQALRSPLSAAGDGQISRDRHSALVEFAIRGNTDDASSRVSDMLHAVAAVQRRNPRLTVAEFGEASAQQAVGRSFSSALARAAELSLPITFLILLLAFGALVAACVPLVLAFSAVLTAEGLAALMSHLVHQSEASNSVILLMGMAVGVDYSLFYLRRERAERRRGNAPAAALQAAAATSGRAVLVSGLTVLIAMGGMLLTGSKVFTSLGVGAMLVVLAALVGSLTVLPALLGRLGDKVQRGTLARSRRGSSRGARARSRAWTAALHVILRRPLLTVLLCTGTLLAMSLPALGMHTSFASIGDILAGNPIEHTYARIQRAFPGSSQPAYIAVSGDDVSRPVVRTALARMEHAALTAGVAGEPIHTLISHDRHVAQVEMPLAGNGADATSERALARLRGQVLPATLGHLPGVEYAVTGQTAGTRDFNQTMRSHAPLVFAFVLGLAFLLLMVAFRSIAIPLSAIALNLLSVGAAYGVLVWIFQDGHLQSLLDFHSDGAVIAWLPLFLFPVLFGLSMDYHVLILSRISELRSAGTDTREAVAGGIRGSAGVITAAAAVMVAVFAVFASLPILELKEMGVGLAVAVLLDATLIRCVLLPATMTLLGERNWYLPRWLGWLPRVQIERHGHLATELA